MFPDKKIKCHRTGFTKSCHKLVTSGTCTRWSQFEGTDPVTGKQINGYDCNDNWEITFQLNVIRKLQNGFLGLQEAIESFRNAVVPNTELPRQGPKVIGDNKQLLINGGSHEGDDQSR